MITIVIGIYDIGLCRGDGKEHGHYSFCCRGFGLFGAVAGNLQRTEP